MADEWIAPVISGSLLVVAGIVAAGASLRNTRTGGTERRAPTVSEAWAEADRARNRAFLFEELFYSCRGALRHLMRLITQHHPDYLFTSDVEQAAKLEAPDDAEAKEKTS